MQPPPLLPAETLARVLRLARVDGMGVMAFAGLFAVLAATGGDTFGAIVGLLVAAAGAIELHGAALLRAGEPRGMGWLVGSQAYLLLAVLAYCGIRLTSLDLPPIPDGMQAMVEESAAQAGLSVPDYLRTVYRLSYGLIAFATVIYQGGMTIYYLRRRAAVAAALEDGLGGDEE